jgi:hypothetical protein
LNISTAIQQLSDNIGGYYVINRQVLIKCGYAEQKDALPNRKNRVQQHKVSPGYSLSTAFNLKLVIISGMSHLIFTDYF